MLPFEEFFAFAFSPPFFDFISFFASTSFFTLVSWLSLKFFLTCISGSGSGVVAELTWDFFGRGIDLAAINNTGSKRDYKMEKA